MSRALAVGMVLALGIVSPAFAGGDHLGQRASAHVVRPTRPRTAGLASRDVRAPAYAGARAGSGGGQCRVTTNSPGPALTEIFVGRPLASIS